MKKGLTFIEILVAIAILGLVSAVAIPSSLTARRKSTNNLIISSLDGIEADARVYFYEGRTMANFCEDNRTVKKLDKIDRLNQEAGVTCVDTDDSSPADKRQWAISVEFLTVVAAYCIDSKGNTMHGGEVADGGCAYNAFLDSTKDSGGGGGGYTALLSLEAENVPRFGSFVVGSSGSASNGEYVHTPTNTSDNWSLDADDRLEFNFVVEEEGTYRLQGFVDSPSNSGNYDSFWVQVDGYPIDGYLWDTNRSADFGADNVNDRDGDDPVTANLTEGPHLIQVFQREGGTRLDKLELIKQ